MEMYETVAEALAHIQQNIKVPKARENKFGGYKYRAQEDILEAVKPLLKNAVLRIDDHIIEVGGRVYVQAKANLTLGEITISNTACAREPETKKGMDESQITGAASSYARKYALNGLFLIDDTQDPDATNDHGKSGPDTAPMQKTGNRTTDKWVKNVIADLQACTTPDYLRDLFGDFWRQAKEKGCTEDQMAGIKYQYDQMKIRLSGKDDIPDYLGAG